MSLYLKVLENENDATLNKPTMLALHEVLLPPLKNNIKCGNSLIGTDFLAQGELFDEEARRKVNPFDWEMEFPESMKNGGFDCVIGNPPYVRIQGFPAEQIEYLASHYESAQGNADLYVSFIERGFKLLSERGRFGMIVPNKFFKTDYGKGVRYLIAHDKAISEIVNFGSNQVFEATTYTCLLFLSRQTKKSFRYVETMALPESLGDLKFKELAHETLNREAWLFIDFDSLSIVKKLNQRSMRLLDLPAEMSRGSSSGADEIFMISSSERQVERELLRKPIFATDFGRYTFSPVDRWKIVFPYYQDKDLYKLYSEHELKKKFPKAFTYLKSNQPELKKRKQYSEWFGFSAPRNLELHDEAQIIIPLLADRGLFALIPEKYSGLLCPMASGGFTITINPTCTLNPKYVLGLLNSSLLFWRLKQMSNIFRGGWITCTKQYFGELPIRTVDFTKPAEKQMHDDLVALVDKMLALHKQFNKVSFDSEKEPIQRQIRNG